MYGYVRPLKGELKVNEYQRFKSMYCGLCHRLKERCGFAARFVVNYDFTLLAMLLSNTDCGGETYRRCAASPLRRKCCYCQDAALDVAADYSVILARWKLLDAIADGGPWERLKSRVCLLLLSGSYARARRAAPEFDAVVQEKLGALSVLEKARCASLDAPADCFAGILAFAAHGEAQEARSRVIRQILYHIGRIVYILDAINDLPEDLESGSYNPLIYRFGLAEPQLSQTQREELVSTLQLSENMLISAFQLLPEGAWTSVIRNILFEGLPAVSALVLEGKWREIRIIQKEKMNGADV